MPKRYPFGPAKVQGVWTLQEVRTSERGVSWHRLIGPGVNRLIGPTDIFDLAELLDDACDMIEDREREET